jgi:diguanylate cyclase (GGDEF)-like protein
VTVDLAAAFEHAPTPLLVSTPEGAVLRANEAARRVLALDEDELRRNGLDRRLEHEAVSAYFEGSDGRQLLVTALHDVTDAPGAYLDALTGLPSRRLFDEHLKLAIARADRERRAVAVIVVDLDGFEALNDLHGPAAGDEVLRRVAQRLQAAARTSDVAARCGGDEFVVLVGDLGRKVSVPAAEGVALRIEDALSMPFELGGESVSCAATVGLSIYPKHVRTADDLVAAATAAMAARKAERRDAA